MTSCSCAFDARRASQTPRPGAAYAAAGAHWCDDNSTVAPNCCPPNRPPVCAPGCRPGTQPYRPAECHTALYPANISTVLFVHACRSPSAAPTRLGPPAPQQGNTGPRRHMAGLRPARQRSNHASSKCWPASTPGGRTPAPLARRPSCAPVGMGSLRLLQEMLTLRAVPVGFDGLQLPSRHTDLRRLLQQHFAMPNPLELTLAAAAQLWELTPTLRVPQDLLQSAEARGNRTAPP